MLTGRLMAGNGPHNWLVVYDPGDPHGVAIARYYQEKRHFPDRNLVAYNFPRRATGSPSLNHKITAAEGYALVQSLRTVITARGLDGQIHGVTLVGNAPNAMSSTSLGTVSITTALAVAPGTTDQAGWEARLDDNTTVFRGPNNETSGTFHPTIEVRSDISYGTNRYWLSTHLGFTGIHGLRPDEVVTLIDRACAADGAAPQGTVYWPLNSNIRSGMREDQAHIVEPEWQALGLSYHIYGQSYGGGSYDTPENKTGVPGSFPHTERAVQGAITGLWTFNLDDYPSVYTKGAIAEHVTSYGGVMGGSLGWSQSECTLWLRAGAAGTSGTVEEPTTNWKKFPHARIHSHYFNGATLAEAFLMSIYMPYQTLVMGDGLTQPYAKIPVVSLSGITEGQTISGTVTLQATATGAAGVETNLDLVVDGRVVKIGSPSESVGATRVAGGFQINTTTLSDGWHELRVVAYAANAVRSQGFAKRAVTVNNEGGSVTLSGATNGVRGTSISLSVSVAGVASVTSIEVRALGQVLATLGASGGTANISTSSLSHLTATRVFAVAKTASGKEVSSAPHAITVQWQPQPALVEVPMIPDAVAVARIFSNDVRAAGFDWNTAVPVAVVPVDERWAMHVEAGNQWPFLKDPINKGGGIEFVTRFHAQETDVYDFVLSGFGAMGMAIDGVDLVSGVIGGSPIMPSAALAAGWHEIRFRAAIPTWEGTFAPQFQPAFRARYTKRLHFLGWPVVEYEYFTMEHCAAPVMDLTLPQLGGSASVSGEAILTWSNPFAATVTGWKVERHTGDAAVSLVQYLGSNTMPTLVSPEDADGLGPLARVANDEDECFAIVPPWLLGGVRLLTAGADREAGPSSILYKVQVPAGTTIYAVFERGNEGVPAWITDQGGWIKVSTWDTHITYGINVSSETTNLWSVYKKSFTADTLLGLGGAGRAVNDTTLTRAITFSFHKDVGVWEEVASLAGNTTGTTVGGGAAGTNRFRVLAQLPPSAKIPSNELVINGGGSTSEVIIDNSDSTGVTITGEWSTSSNVGGFHGANYLHDNNIGKGQKSVRYTPNLAADTYDVYVRYTSDPNRASNVPIDITHANGTDCVSLDQRTGGGAWVLLGTYAFNSGTSGNVLIGNAGTVGFVVADAVRFVPSGTSEVIIDNSDSTGVTITGSWSTSSNVGGFYGSNYLHDDNTGKGQKSVRYTPNLAAGTYDVYVRYTSDPNRASNVPIDITHANGAAYVSLDQRTGGGAWVLLGTYTFNSGTSGNVLISNTGTNGHVVADAVRFVPSTSGAIP